MLRGSKPLTFHQASTYYTREYSRGDYYTGSAGRPAEALGEWQGRGAAELGLSGAVERERFQELLSGRLDGVRLVAPEAASGVHRAAWDFQVSPDKSVSLVALVGGDERVVAAHRAAAAEAFAVLERFAAAKDRSRQVVLTGNLVAARFDHDASRSLDPQLHSHHVVFNMTRRPDGEWRGLESRSLFRVQSLATAAYHLELARRLQGLGYGLDIDSRGYVRIAGIPESARLHFSRRRREILAEVARQGGVKDPQRAALKTRRHKDHGVDREALRGSWGAAAERLGLDFAGLRRDAAARLAAGGGPAGAGEGAEPCVAWAVAHLGERQAVFSRIELETAALRQATGRGPTAAAVRAAVAAPPGVVAGAGERLTTVAALRLEGANLERMRDALGERRPPVSPTPWQAADLAPDQLRAARHILECPAQLLAIEGKPGTGKTRTLARVREAAVGRGWTVRGFAVTTGAVEELSKVGIAASTVKGLEVEGLVRAAGGGGGGGGAPRELWIADEAGLLGNRDAQTLLERARLAGARLVLVGDRGQHHAVAAGKPFVDLQRAGLVAVRLDAIRRQQVPELLAAVRLSAGGRAGQAVELLARHGHVTEIRGAAARHQAMALAYLAAPADSLMIAPSHAERMEFPLDLSQPGDVVRLEEAIAACGARLVVIDPIQAFLGARTDIYRPNEVRAVLAPLLRLAARQACALLVLRHITKARASRSIYAGQGSVDFVAAARSVLLAGSAPDHPERHALVHIKSNLAALGPALGYRFDGRSFVWEGASRLSANDLLAPDTHPDDAGAEAEAVGFVRELLGGGEAMPARAVLAAAREAGIAERTLKRAKRRAGVVTLRQGFGAGATWLWSLGAEAEAGEGGQVVSWHPSGEVGPLRGAAGTAAAAGEAAAATEAESGCAGAAAPDETVTV